MSILLVLLSVASSWACNPQQMMSPGEVLESIKLDFDVAPPISWTIALSPRSAVDGQSTTGEEALSRMTNDAALVLAEYNQARDQITCTVEPQGAQGGFLVGTVVNDCDSGDDLIKVNGVVRYSCSSTNSATTPASNAGTDSTVSTTEVSTTTGESSPSTVARTTVDSVTVPNNGNTFDKISVHLRLKVECTSKGAAAKYLWSIFATKLQDRLEAKNVFFNDDIVLP